MPHLKAVYCVRPTAENIRLLQARAAPPPPSPEAPRHADPRAVTAMAGGVQGSQVRRVPSLLHQPDARGADTAAGTGGAPPPQLRARAGTVVGALLARTRACVRACVRAAGGRGLQVGALGRCSSVESAARRVTARAARACAGRARGRAAGAGVLRRLRADQPRALLAQRAERHRAERRRVGPGRLRPRAPGRVCRAARPQEAARRALPGQLGDGDAPRRVDPGHHGHRGRALRLPQARRAAAAPLPPRRRRPYRHSTPTPFSPVAPTTTFTPSSAPLHGPGP